MTWPAGSSLIPACGRHCLRLLLPVWFGEFRGVPYLFDHGSAPLPNLHGGLRSMRSGRSSARCNCRRAIVCRLRLNKNIDKNRSRCFGTDTFRMNPKKESHALRKVFSSKLSSSTRRSMGLPLSNNRIVSISMSTVWLLFSSVPTVLT